MKPASDEKSFASYNVCNFKLMHFWLSISVTDFVIKCMNKCKLCHTLMYVHNYVVSVLQ